MSKKKKTETVNTQSEPRRKTTPSGNVSVQLVYLGPTIPGIVKNATVFKGELPQSLKMAIDDFPLMCRLIVPVAESPSVVKELKKKQSSTASIYKMIAEKYNF